MAKYVDTDIKENQYPGLTQREYSSILEDLIDEMDGNEILMVDDAYGVFSEYFNNEVLQRWADSHPFEYKIDWAPNGTVVFVKGLVFNPAGVLVYEITPDELHEFLVNDVMSDVDDVDGLLEHLQEEGIIPRHFSLDEITKYPKGYTRV